MIFKTVELFKQNEDILFAYQERFRYIMVDEYQDTNTVQFKFVSMLAGKYGNLCVVGDDDQSIYKFRGANIQNILNFENTFDSAKVIKLEQNYRSTKTILEAANSVIKNNLGRKDKTLWTANNEGEKINFCLYEDAYKEAEGVVNGILVRGNMVGDLVFIGSGAGKLPTASAVVSDVVDAVRHLNIPVTVIWDKEKLELLEFGKSRKSFFVRVEGDEKDKIEEAFENVTYIDAGIENEIGFVTRPMSEDEFKAASEKLENIITRIRIEE